MASFHVTAKPLAAEPAITLSAEQITAIEASVRTRLKNHDLAKLSGIVTKSISGPTLAVCGYVNAKASSGGYIGDLAFDGFLLNNKGWRFRVLVIDDASHIPARRTCRDWGLF
jgi:hypothetical protein